MHDCSQADRLAWGPPGSERNGAGRLRGQAARQQSRWRWEEFHDKLCLLFQRNHNHSQLSGMAELTTADQLHGAPQRPDPATHRGRNFNLDRSQCEAVQNLEAAAPWHRPAKIAARSIAGVKPERANGWWYRGVAGLKSGAPAKRSHPR